MSGECDDCGEHCLECRCRQEKQSSWNNVKDKLPPNGTRCLVYEMKGQHMHNCSAHDYPYPCCEPNIAYYTKFGGWKWSSFENWIPTPTHWMPLPDRPLIEGKYCPQCRQPLEIYEGSYFCDVCRKP